MSSPSNVWNTDGFPSIAYALLFGTTLVPLNQSTATTGFIPQVQTNGGLTLTAPSGLGITWADVLAAGNTSGANNAIMSAGQALNFADGTVKINSAAALGTNAVAIGTSSSAGASGVAVGASATANSTGVAVGSTATSPSNAVAVGNGATVASTSAQGIAIGNLTTAVEDLDIVLGSLSLTVGTGGNGRRIAIGDGATAGAASTPYSIAIGSISSSTANSSIAIGRAATVSSTQSIGIGISTIPSGSNDICLGPNAITPGTGGAGGRISIGSSTTAGAASVPFSLAIGANASAAGSAAIAIGRLATATPLQSISIGISTSTAGNNDIAFGSQAVTTNAARSARISIGVNCAVSGDQATGLGTNVTVTHNNSTAIGRNAATTADNQIMIGNNASGTTNQVYHDVGTAGLMESSGYCVTFNQVRASIQPTAGQVIASGAGFTIINMATVNYSSDYGTPSIASVASQIQTRANRSMVGALTVNMTFAGLPVAAGHLQCRIQKNTNGVINTMASTDFYVTGGMTTYSFTIPFVDYNATTPAPNVYYYCDINNPAAFARNMTINTATHFVCMMAN